MAWSDPSPRQRRVSAMQSSPVQPGYGAREVRGSFLTFLARAGMTLVVAACVFAELRSIVRDHVTGPHPALEVALPLAIAVLVGWLLLRFLLRRPESGRAHRGGWGWFGRRREWDDRYRSTGFGEAVAGEAIGEAVGAMLDAALD